MENKQNYGECLSQVCNSWRKENDKYKYIFQIFPYKEIDDNENMYELHIINTITNEIAFSFYRISSENGSYFIEFLGTTYKILHIDNSIKIPIMKLEDNDGNIIIYENKD